MNFKKRPVSKADLTAFSLIPLVDPVSRNLSEPKSITMADGEDIYLVSLSNQHIAFNYEMPRYFLLNYQGFFVFFFVIDHAELRDEEAKSIFAKGIKMPKRLIRQTSDIRQLIIKALFVYYGDYKINQIILDDVEQTGYYISFIDGQLSF